MSNQQFSTRSNGLLAALFVVLSAAAVMAQTTQFTYQGRLTDSSMPANGSYDFQFKLYDALADGAQVGGTLSPTNISVSNGIFTVTLDFGSAGFSGANRWLDISVRLAGGGGFTTLSPRQPITSTPYAIKSVSAANADGLSVACINCVTSGQIGSVLGSQVSGLIPVASVPAGSGNYVQNTTTQQASANFNISGNGTAGGTLSANIINATTQYNLNGNRLLSAPGINNLFAGVNAGTANTTGGNNAFFGDAAGSANTTGFANAFFGRSAGGANTTGNNNTFFGYRAGAANTTASTNSFFGSFAGNANTSGNGNSFFGALAGRDNTEGFSNAFFGGNAGLVNTTGSSNAFFGYVAGTANTTGSQNAFFGPLAGNKNTTGGSNSFFGSNAGRENIAGALNSFFGQNAGLNTTSTSNSFFGASAGQTNTTGFNNTLLGASADVGANNLFNATAIGAGAVVSTSETIVLGRSAAQDTVRVPGRLVVGTLAAAANNHVCINGAGELAACASSLRYKQNVAPLTAGLNLIQRLRPVTFTWKESKLPDMGLIAEEVAAVEPLLVTHNAAGEIQGVRYDQLNVVLINAVKAQQALIQQQQTQLATQQQLNTQLQQQLKTQQEEIASLKRLVCLSHPQAAICRTFTPQK